ncbi:MAG: hypothetical protein CMR00_00700 [[Chlorobium] sp. 445]|nr:MAG: hypothetical protein CMR00_00700 [[Chlorobium] sp. 445]
MTFHRSKEHATSKTHIQSLLNAVFQASPVPMLICDFKTGEILAANEAFLKFSEYSQEELLGKTAFELSLWENPAARHLSLHNLNTTPLEFQVAFLTKSGTRCLVKVKLSSLKSAGNSTR